MLDAEVKIPAALEDLLSLTYSDPREAEAERKTGGTNEDERKIRLSSSVLRVRREKSGSVEVRHDSPSILLGSDRVKLRMILSCSILAREWPRSPRREAKESVGGARETRRA